MLGRGACEEREEFPGGQRKRRCLRGDLREVRVQAEEEPVLRLGAGMCLACGRSSLEARGAESELGAGKG